MKEKLTSIRLSSEIEGEIEKMALSKDTDKSKLMRDLLILGLKEKKLQEVLELYAKGRITMWKAARMAGLSMWEMMDIIAQRKITMPYGMRELEQDLQGLKE